MPGHDDVNWQTAKHFKVITEKLKNNLTTLKTRDKTLGIERPRLSIHQLVNVSKFKLRGGNLTFIQKQTDVTFYAKC